MQIQSRSVSGRSATESAVWVVFSEVRVSLDSRRTRRKRVIEKKAKMASLKH